MALVERVGEPTDQNGLNKAGADNPNDRPDNLGGTSKGERPSSKAGWTALVLGSSFISVLVSTFLSSFILDLKSDYGVRKDFATLISEISQKHHEGDELDASKLLSLVVAPLYTSKDPYGTVVAGLMIHYQELHDAKYKADPHEADRKQVGDSSTITPSEAAKALQQSEAIAPGRTVKDIQDNFFSPLRRQFSDIMLSDIEQSPEGTVNLLLDSIIADQNDARSYRVNLYIAFTLGRTKQWTSNPTRKAKLESLKSTRDFLDQKDTTYKDTVTRALNKYKSPER